MLSDMFFAPSAWVTKASAWESRPPIGCPIAAEVRYHIACEIEDCKAEFPTAWANISFARYANAAYP